MDTAAKSQLLTRCLDLLGENQVFSRKEQCWAYGYDNSRRQCAPDLVAFPRHHDDVEKIAGWCNELQIPFLARGRGTGTTGASVPVRGGLVLSTERMTQILKSDPDNRVLVVQTGITNQAVQDHAAKLGFFWPPDPTSAAYCTIGGNLAFNSAGPRAIKYGTPRENTLGLRAVTGNGQSIKTGTYTTKGVVGYDLTRLLIGSEGTLAIMTEATLKLTPLPQRIQLIRAFYRDMHCAARAVSRLMRQPVIPYTLEFIDGQAIAMIREYSKVQFPSDAGALLMIEIDGDPDGMAKQTAHITQAAQGEGLVSIEAAQSEQEIKNMWETRKALSPALRTLAPKKINEDVVVPVSHMGDLIQGLAELSRKYAIPIVNFGHAGNGNIHVNLLVDSDNPTQMHHAHDCLSEVFDLVLRLDGTLSGEHGVGMEKQNYVVRELGQVNLDLMLRIKALFDPLNLLNPQKIFPL